MNTVQPLGTHNIAGSKEYPTTYKIRACPTCYGVLYWSRKDQTTIACENCGTEVIMVHFKSPIAYARHKIRERPLSLDSVLFAVYALVQLLDYKLHMRKMLLFTFIRGLSHL